MVRGSLCAEVAEHGVRFPSPQEGNIVGVHIRAHEGCSAARADRASGEEGIVDPCGRLEAFGGVPEAIGDVGGFDRVPARVARMGVKVLIERGVRGCLPLLEAADDAA